MAEHFCLIVYSHGCSQNTSGLRAGFALALCAPTWAPWDSSRDCRSEGVQHLFTGRTRQPRCGSEDLMTYSMPMIVPIAPYIENYNPKCVLQINMKKQSAVSLFTSVESPKQQHDFSPCTLSWSPIRRHPSYGCRSCGQNASECYGKV